VLRGKGGKGGGVFLCVCICDIYLLRGRGEKGREIFVCVCMCDICVERESRG